MKNVSAIFRREFKSYFDSPVAYVFLTAFLVLVGFLTFGVAKFYEARQADLTAFFFWHPWVYLLLVPAATMGLWADERRNGTMEQLLTLPITVWEALAGKFLAAWAFIGIGLALTFPVAATAGYLGSPDWGAVACGYVGSLFLAGAATAIGLFASSLSRSSVVGFVVALVMVFVLLLAGFEPITGALLSWGLPTCVVDGVASLSLLSHFESMRRGVIDLADVGYYAAVAVFFLVAAKTVTDGRRGASKGALALVLVAAAELAAVAVLSNLPLRVDLTAERLYTISKGSRAVLAKLDKDVTLKFYVSSSAAEMPMNMKSYAAQVENLLGEYERASSRIVVEKYDPAPDSDAEEWAQRYDIEPQRPNPFASPIYFGLVAVCGDREETIGTLSQSTESTLEYDLTRLVTRVAWPERPVVGVMTSLDGVLGGAMNPMMLQMGRRPPQGWAAFAELAKDYDVRSVATDAEKIDDDVKTLVVLHAKGLSDKTLYAIDQFVCRGGRLVACVDPASAKEVMAARERGGMGGQGCESSTLGKLFEAWGVGFDTSKVVCDLDAAVTLNAGDGSAAAEPAFMALGADAMAKGDLVVSGLGQVMLPFAGAFTFDEAKGKDLKFTPVMATSEKGSSEADSSLALMGGTLRSARPDGKSRVVAARLDGTFKTAYPQGPDGTNAVEGAVAEGKGTVLLFGDSDFLADEFCVRLLRTPFGNLIQPLNDNLKLFANVIEQFAGREELIGLRTRGASSRPFEVVDRLEAAARAKWQEKAEALQNKLQAAERRINELQAQKTGGERMLLTREQEEEILKARRAQAETGRELKNVRKELTADINSLGSLIKFLNIALVPMLVALFGVVRALLRRRS